jgi:hypothetical protein
MPSFRAVPGVAGGLVMVVREVLEGAALYGAYIVRKPHLPRLHANVSLARSIIADLSS